MSQTRRSYSPWLALAVLALGLFMTLLDLTIVNVAIPSILDGLHASLDQVLPGTMLWVCYPKPGKLETDLGRDKLWMFMKGRGFEPVRVVSVDDTWSAFSFKK